MSFRRKERHRTRPPWWFMPAVMAGVGGATVALAFIMSVSVE